jgi:hypothetical protein
MKLVDLVPLKEGSAKAKALAKQYSMSQLQRMLDQRLGPDQEAAFNMPGFDPNEFSDSEDFGPSANDLDAAITIKRGGDVPYDVAIGRMTQDEYDEYMSTVKPDRDSFEKSSKFDRMNETTEKAWNAVDVSRKAEKAISNKEWNERTAKKLAMLKDLNKAGKFKKDFDEETLQGWVDKNYSWGQVSNKFEVNEGSCGYSVDGKPANKPAGPHLLRKAIRQEIRENFDDRLKSMMGADDFKKATNPKLAKLINNAIMTVDPNMSYRDFAKGVAQVLIDEYGVQNYEPFIKELKKALDSTLG